MRQTKHRLTDFPKYEIHDNGTVISFHHRRGLKPPTVLKHRLSNTGYPYVMVTDGKNKKVKKIHRLIAEYFIPNPKGLPQVNHINSDRTDFRIENLEWVTPLDNVRHCIATGRMNKANGEKAGLSKLFVKQVTEIRERYNNGEYQANIAKDYGISQTTVGRIVTGKTWRSV